VDDSLDPTLPCPYPPGSPEKIAVLEARAEAELPSLFLPEDAAGVRHLQDPRTQPFEVSLRSRRERALLGALNGHGQTARQLAAVTSIPLRRVHAALGLLKEAGCVEFSRQGGWRLTEVRL
jgi:hypothetical protein